MPINTGDIILLTVVQELLGQQCINVTTWRSRDTNAQLTMFDISEYFEAEWFPRVNAFQSNLVNNVEVRVDNITGGLTFAVSPAGGTGAIADGVNSPYDSWGFTKLRSTKVTRTGSMRVPGVPDSVALAGVLQAGVALTAAGDFSLWAAAPQTITAAADGSTIVLDHVIVGRDSISGDFDLTRVNGIPGITVNPNVTTQNSRKFGRGA